MTMWRGFFVSSILVVCLVAIPLRPLAAQEQEEAKKNEGQTEAISAAQAEFDHIDTNSDGVLSEEELQVVSSQRSPQQILAVFDLDRSGSISFEEFRLIPDLIERKARGQLDDPVTRLAREQIKLIRRQLPVPIPADDLEVQWGGKLPGTVPLQKDLWDRNNDGRIDDEECLRGLEEAWGLIRFDGQPARQSTGFVFNGSYFTHLDRNQDGKISQSEFVTRHPTGPETARTIFQEADQNSDGELDLDEIDAAGLFLVDVVAAFLKWDRNGDGQIDRMELNQGERWQHRLAVCMIPAFDTDGSGTLSLTEFIFSPLGNPMENWTSLRKDLNGDGVLDPGEFLSSKGLRCSGLAMEYFRRLDRNQDGILGGEEFRFHVNWNQLTPQQQVMRYDRDGDGYVSLKELCAPFGVHAPNQPLPDPLVPHHSLLFALADHDGDDRLSAKELSSASELHSVNEVETRLQEEILPWFRKLDTNNDGELSPEEVAASPQFSADNLSQWATIFDFDGSGALSLLEFAAIPTVSTLAERPHVPDPLLDQAIEIVERVLERWPDGTRELGASEAVALVIRQCPFVTIADLTGWDTNSNGAYDRNEVRDGVLKLYGMRSFSGPWMRRSNGQVFNLRSARDADLDGDQFLNAVEFERAWWKKGAESRNDFERTDIDGDKRLSLEELLTGDLFWIDPVQEFLRLDLNQDGLLDPDELHQGASPYERRMTASLFPAFDRDGDGKLSFLEYRQTPLANPVHDYDSRRWDQDYDGKLSLLEFHRASDRSRQPVGLSHLFFIRYDRNQDGSLSYDEFKFSANLKQEAPEFVFQVLDLNNDGLLQLEELLQRERPADQSAWSKRKSEQRIMEVEEAFLSADTNHDQVLSREEFLDEKATIRRVVLGMNRPVPSGRSSSTANSPSRGRWLTIAIIGANLVLFTGIAWWRLRQAD